MSESPTTPELVERYRLGFTNHRQDVDSLMGLFDPDAVWEVRGLGTSFEGAAAIRGFVADWNGAYGDLEVDAEEILELGSGVLFVVWVQKGRLVDSGGPLRYRFAQVVTWANGVIVKITGYQDIDEARVAAERLAKERG